MLHDIVGGRDERRDANGLMLDPLLDRIRKVVRREPQRCAYVGVPETLIIDGE